VERAKKTSVEKKTQKGNSLFKKNQGGGKKREKTLKWDVHRETQSQLGFHREGGNGKAGGKMSQEKRGKKGRGNKEYFREVLRKKGRKVGGEKKDKGFFF